MQHDLAEAESGGGSDSFSGLMHQHARLVDNDVDAPGEPVIDPDSWENIKISDLFDFANTAWSTMYGGFVRRSFKEELVLYELLERDAEGEEDLDDADQPSCDSTTEDFLFS
ncbi:hypothetical protein B0H34DRAFT_801085 [Crassisporium funariophilum]|nr:hypothetical protein B0H34DRAFT_801085 [Crassisporium funariophilum]